MTTSVTILLFLIIYVEIGKFQRFSPLDMTDWLRKIGYLKSEASVQCAPILEGKLLPEFDYFHFVCDSTASKTEELINEVDVEACTGFDCWESQLTDNSRLEILDIMNTYRQIAAEGRCQGYCEHTGYRRRLIFELRWSPFLERKAQQTARKCIRFYIHGGMTEENGYIETVSYSFPMVIPFQRELRITLRRLLDENRLVDWDLENNLEFRRGLMTDVGCAFILRRNVKNVKVGIDLYRSSGDIGYFTCTFSTTANSQSAPFHLTPSEENCKSTSITHPTEFYPFSYYPSLCKLASEPPTLVCQVEPQYRGKKTCDGSGDTRSPKTWKEALYGYSIKYDSAKGTIVEAKCHSPHLASFVRPQSESHPHHRINIVCTLKQEVHVRGDPICGNWNCRDSQLRDETKERILETLNKARLLVAKGECSKECPPPCTYCTKIEYCNMMKLRWHWYLERRAAEVVGSCISPQITSRTYIDGPFPRPIVADLFFLVFDLPPSGQIDLPARLYELFWMNAFSDWRDDQFTRANALWIGCAILIRPNEVISDMNPKYKLENGTATNLACIYATSQTEMTSISGSSRNDSCCPKCFGLSFWFLPCQYDSVKNVAPFNELCTSTSSQITMSCEVNDCESGESEAWETVFSGITAIEDVDSSLREKVREARSPMSPPNTTQYPINHETPLFVQKYCTILLIILVILLSLLCVILSLVLKFVIERQVFGKRNLVENSPR